MEAAEDKWWHKAQDKETFHCSVTKTRCLKKIGFLASVSPVTRHNFSFKSKILPGKTDHAPCLMTSANRAWNLGSWAAVEYNLMYN